MSRETHRADLLAHFVCPDHHYPLEECEDRDEFGVTVWYRCTAAASGGSRVEHFFGSVYDHASGLYWPVEEAAPANGGSRP